MNLSNLKQRLQNNLWYGEQRRAFHYDPEMFSLVATYIEPDYTKAWYIDISPWDGGAVQLGVTKSLGCSGVWIKGVDGSVNSNHFVANYTTAVSVGLPRSAYAWLYRDANVRATAQAQAFDTLLNKYPPSPELLPLVDFEYTKYAGAQSNPDFTDLRKWLTEWLRLGNPKPIVYSGKYYMDQFGAMPSDVRGMIAGLHIANYSSLNPPLPIGFTEWTYHQFTSSGDAMKIAPNNVNKLALDLNYGRGAIVTPPQNGVTMKGVVQTTLTIRNATNDPIGTLYAGDVVYGEIKLAYNLQRLFFTHVYRKATPTVFQTWATGSNAAVADGTGKVLIVTSNEAEPGTTPPPPAPVGDIQFNAILKADGSVTGTWKEI